MFLEYKFNQVPIDLNTINFLFGLCLFGLIIIIYDFIVDYTNYLLLKFVCSLVLILVDIAFMLLIFWEYLYHILYKSYHSNKNDRKKAVDNTLIEDLEKEKLHIEKGLERLKQISIYIHKYNWFVGILIVIVFFHMGIVITNIYGNENFRKMEFLHWLNIYGFESGTQVKISYFKLVLSPIPAIIIFVAYLFLSCFVVIGKLFEKIGNPTSISIFMFIGIVIVMLYGFIRFNLVGWIYSKLNKKLKLNREIEKVEESEI
jgi:hypothetical protein